MSEERKSRSIWPRIAALLIGLPVLYVATFGPACSITSRLGSGAGMIRVLYRPLIRSFWNEDNIEWPGGSALLWYSKIGAAPGWDWRLGWMWDADGDVDGDLVWAASPPLP